MCGVQIANSSLNIDNSVYKQVIRRSVIGIWPQDAVFPLSTNPLSEKREENSKKKRKKEK